MIGPNGMVEKMSLLDALRGSPEQSEGTQLSEYKVTSENAIQLGGEIKPLMAEFEREGTDLVLREDTGDYIVVKDYFQSFPAPDLLTEGGAKLVAETVARLAGPGPVAQAGNTASDANEAIGEITSLAGTVTVRHADGTRDELVEGFAVFQGDVLETSSDGSFTITFVDDTNFTMGPDGRAILDELIYNPNGSSSNGMGISLLQGAFSLVSGKIAKDDPESVNIKTPVGTIGIRGTSWSGKILQQGEQSAFTLFTGSILVSNEGGEQLLTLPNQTVLVSSNFIAPSPPQVLTEGQLLDLYGGVLNLINPDWFKDEEEDDFDPSKINPEAGPRGQNSGGGGADFAEFSGTGEDGGLGISGILGLSELLNETELEFDGNGFLNEEIGGEEPVAAVQVIPTVDPETSLVNGFTIEVVLDSPTDVPVSVFYEIIPVTASDGSDGGDPDYMDEGGGTITVLPGETGSGFSLTLLDDDIIEDTETLIIRLTGAENAVINPAASSALVVIVDDDIGVVSIQPVTSQDTSFSSFAALADVSAFSEADGSSTVVTEGDGDAVFRLILDKALGPGVEVRVDYTVEGAGVGRTDFSPGEVRSAFFNGGETGLLAGSEIEIRIPILDNDLVDPFSDFSVRIVGGSENMIADDSNGQVAVTVEDDETAVIAGDADEADVAESGIPATATEVSLGLEGGSGALQSAVFDDGQPSFDALGLTSGGVPVTLTGLGTSEIAGWAGEEQIFTVSLSLNGQYNVTLLKPLDHLQEGSPVDSLSLSFGYGAVDVNGSSTQGTLTVNVDDDVPQATDDNVDVPIPPLPSYNLLFVLDSSGSMNAGERQDDGSVTSRIAILKEAVVRLISEYGAQSSELKISIIDFDSNAEFVFSGSSVQNAIDFIENPQNLVAGGQTNYADALADDENGARGILNDQLADPANQNFKTITYFVSDGQPFPQSNGVPVDENGNAWQEFVDQNDIEVVSVGIGNNIDIDALNLVENEGDVAVNVLKASDLEAFLVSTIPTVSTGSVVRDSISGDELGADGATATQIILTVENASELDGYVGQGGSVSGPVNSIYSVVFDIPQDGTDLDLLLADGSHFRIDKNGGYTLETPAGSGVGEEIQLDYRLTDGDGDVSQATLTFTFVEETQPEVLTSETVGTTNTVSGTPSSENLTGTEQADLIVGGGGNDTLEGGEGADTFRLTADAGSVTDILDFDVSSDFLDLDALFDAVGVVTEDREQGEGWEMGEADGHATLFITGLSQQVSFLNTPAPDVSDLTAIAERVIIGDES